MSSIYYPTAWHTTVVEILWNCDCYYFLTHLSPWHLSTHDLVLQHSIPGHGKDLASSTVSLFMHPYFNDILTFTISTSLRIICFDFNLFFLYFSLTIVSLNLIIMVIFGYIYILCSFTHDKHLLSLAMVLNNFYPFINSLYSMSHFCFQDFRTVTKQRFWWPWR